jgi:hypothetical protein
MADDFLGVIAAAAADIAIQRAAKRRRWVRIISAISSLLLVVFIGGLIYVTVRYS